MTPKGLFTLLLWFLGTLAIVIGSDQVINTCTSEVFKAECSEDEAVLMRSALYGRMEVGRCATEDFGRIGKCTNNVLGQMDMFCSGRPTCELELKDNTFKKVRQCHKDLKSFMQSKYDCIQVVQPPETCQYQTKTTITETSGFLSSHVTRSTGCGNTENPWVLEVPPGQKINISLIDFSYFNSNTNSKPNSASYPSNVCRVYATIRDLSTMQSKTICGGKERLSHVSYSASNMIEIRILSQFKETEYPHFLLQFKATGCPDIPEDDAYWSERIEDKITVGCKANNDQWAMTCIGDKWEGRSGNCTPVALTAGGLKENTDDMPHGTSILLISAIAIGVGTLILVVGIICIKWRMRVLDARYYENPEVMAVKELQGGGTYQKYTPGDPNTRPYPPPIPENEYASMRLLPAPPGDYDQRIKYTTHHPDSYPPRPMSPHFNRPMSPDHIYESPESERRQMQQLSLFTPHYFDLDPQEEGHARRVGTGPPPPGPQASNFRIPPQGVKVNAPMVPGSELQAPPPPRVGVVGGLPNNNTTAGQLTALCDQRSARATNNYSI